MLSLLPLILVVILTLQGQAFVSLGPSLKHLTVSPTNNGSMNTVYLQNYAPSVTVIVPLLNGKISVDERQALRAFHEFSSGSFGVKAPENHFVVAIVQVLRLSKVMGNPDDCLDYLQFSEVTSNNESRSSPLICGVVEGQDLDLKPAGLNGPRTFVASSGEMNVHFFAVANKIYQENEIGQWRPGMTVEISFTAVPKTNLVNLVGLLLITHMGLCQFMNYDARRNDTWIYCPNPDIPDCVHMSLFCETDMHCVTDESMESMYGLDRELCNQVNYYRSGHLTARQKTLWKLWDTEIKIQDSSTSLKLELTQLVVIAAGAVLTGIFVAAFFWRLFHFLDAKNRFKSQNANNNPKKGEELNEIVRNKHSETA